MNILEPQPGESRELTVEQRETTISEIAAAESLMQRHTESIATLYKSEVLRAQYCRDELLGTIEKIAKILNITDQDYIGNVKNECRSTYNNSIRSTLITIPEGTSGHEAVELLAQSITRLIDSILANAEDFIYMEEGVTEGAQEYERGFMIAGVFQGVLLPILKRYELDQFVKSEELSKVVTPYLAALNEHTLEEGTGHFNRVREVVANADYEKILIESLPYTLRPDPEKVSQQVREQLLLLRELGQNSVLENDQNGSYINDWETTFELHKKQYPKKSDFPQSN
jgi:hypothetical protein